MRKIALIIGGFLMMATVIGSVTEAWANCPPGTRYACQQGFNGKVICSCQ